LLMEGSRKDQESETEKAEPEKAEAEKAEAEKAEPEKAAPEATTRKFTKAELVSEVIRKFETKLATDELKPTVGDLLRLLQMEQEMEEEQPREIRVSWIDGDEKGHASEE